MSTSLPQVVLVGRINVGKSTLFNRLTDSAQAIVSPIPGTTRDLNRRPVSWRGTTFRLVDTGGLDASQLGAVERFVEARAHRAVTEADVVVLVLDGHVGVTPVDRTIAKKLTALKKKVIVTANKVDGPRDRQQLPPNTTRHGFGGTHLVSALSGVGTGDLLDAIVESLPGKRRTTAAPVPDCNIAIIGKTNVGKSSLLNAIIGEELVIVTPLPHTTREPQDTVIRYHGRYLRLVDTAGLRKHRKLSDPLETISSRKTVSTLKRADVVLLVTDVSQPLTVQDIVIAELASRHDRGVIIVANKWDLIDGKTTESLAEHEERYHHYLPGLDWAPILFTSAKTKQRVRRLLDLGQRVYANRRRSLPPTQLAAALRRVTPKQASPRKNKKAAMVRKLIQTGTEPPRFSILVDRPDRLHRSYANLLEKELRQRADFTGTPITIDIARA